MKMPMNLTDILSTLCRHPFLQEPLEVRRSTETAPVQPSTTVEYLRHSGEYLRLLDMTTKLWHGCKKLAGHHARMTTDW